MAARLFLNHDANYDWLIALEYGLSSEGRPGENWRAVSDQFAYLFSAPEGGRCLGFVVRRWSEFDPQGDDVADIWDRPVFDVPVLGLRDASAGAVIVAADWFLDGDSTINRHFFNQAVAARRRPRRAIERWRDCLQTGDVMAHYGLGYTLYELGSYHEAYRHLRAYAEICPHHAWAWCWFGKAAAAIGETAEAERAYRRALQVEQETDDETEAAELLDELIGRDHS